MDLLGQRVKDPNDVRTYTINWAAWLTSISSEIDTSTWILPAALTLDDESHTTTLANVRVADGADGGAYRVINEVLTASGEVKRVYFELQVAVIQ